MISYCKPSVGLWMAPFMLYFHLVNYSMFCAKSRHSLDPMNRFSFGLAILLGRLSIDQESLGMNQQNAAPIWPAIAVLISWAWLALSSWGFSRAATSPSSTLAASSPRRPRLFPVAYARGQRRHYTNPRTQCGRHYHPWPPAVPVPTAGQVFLLAPLSAEMVGWAQADDEKANHLGITTFMPASLMGNNMWAPCNLICQRFRPVRPFSMPISR